MKIFSFVQLRGSMPFIWQQKPTMKWEPKGSITMDNHNVDVAQKHFEKALKEYGKEVLINLIDKKGTQKKLGDEFEKVINQLNNPLIRFIWFDFHHECRKMKWENLSKLLDKIDQEIKAYGCFQLNTKKGNFESLEPVSRQTGSFRTNCMDCLDRTNVVQSVIARRLLWNALRDSEIIQIPGHLGPFEKFTSEELEKKFREVWSRNADVISILYTGTNAMKTDFTRTGKRTKKGALMDGKYAVTRWVKNNFYDGYNQNCVDLVTGKYKPKEHQYKKKPFNDFFYLVFLILCMPFVIKYILDTLDHELFAHHQNTSSGKVKSTIFYYTVFGLSIFMLFKAIGSNASKFIEKPILKH